MKLSKLSYLEKGSGIPVVLLHAFPLNSMMWQGQLAGLSSSARIICPDLPGFGRSPRMTFPTITAMARSVSDLMGALKIRKPAIVMGISMGGYVALEFARMFPGRLKALGLFSTWAGKDPRPKQTKRRELASTIRLHGSDVLVKNSLPALIGRTARKDHPEFLKKLEKLMRANRPDGIADSLLAMASRKDSAALLPEIRVPTLVLAGAEDEVIPMQEMQDLRRSIPGANLKVMERAGHLLNLEQPRQFNAAVRRFISSAA